MSWSLEGKKHETRTTPNFKNIKIVPCHSAATPQPERTIIDWRKTVTAATAALKKPHLLEVNYRSYTLINYACETRRTLRKPRPRHTNQTPNTEQTQELTSKRTPQGTRPSWWVAADKEKGDTFAQLSTRKQLH